MKDKCKNNPSREETQKCVCSFASLRELLICCAALIGSQYQGESSLYVNCEERIYYLVVEEPNYLTKELPVYPELCEYSFRVFRLPYLVTVLDQCDVICCDRAVEVMAALK